MMARHFLYWHGPGGLCCQPFDSSAVEQLDPTLTLYRTNANHKGGQAQLRNEIMRVTCIISEVNKPWFWLSVGTLTPFDHNQLGSRDSTAMVCSR